MVPYKDIGTIYPDINITDAFGTLIVTNQGCLLSNDWGHVVVPAQIVSLNDTTVIGKGWSIELNQGFELTEKDGQV